MNRPVWRGLLWVLAGGLAMAGLAGTLVRRDDASIEHGNRLYRDGQIDEAADIYRARAASDLRPGTAAYNLGTLLFAQRAPDAEEFLRSATESPDADAAQRAYYNLGYDFLTNGVQVESPDSALGLLMAAVSSNRAALRLDPAHEDARWNLVIAQLTLTALVEALQGEAATAEEEEAPTDETGMIIPAVPRSGPQRVEREALAGEDPGSLNEAEARALLDAVLTDPEALIRGILWSHRPDVDPWAEAYPGGNK